MSGDTQFVARVATPNDITSISMLQSTDAGLSKQIFGASDVATCIESALLSVVVEHDSQLVAFGVFNDRLQDAEFETVVKNVQMSMASSALVTIGNTIAITTIVLDGSVADSEAGAAIFRTLIRFASSVCCDIDQFLFVQPLSAKGRDTLPNPFRAVFLRVPPSHTHGRTVYLLPRATFVPDLLVRAARVEDHDDLVPVFESRSEVIQDTFGTYYLAEIIEKQDANNVVLVGEGPEGKAVGLMAAASAVDIDLLTACFDLTPFAGLVKRTKYQMLVDEHAAVINSRSRRDWYSLLHAHADELQGIFDHLVVAGHEGFGLADDDEKVDDSDEYVSKTDVINAFNTKGDAWGYVGTGGAKMGTAMMRDVERFVKVADVTESTRLSKIGRQQLNTLVEEFSARREQAHRRRRICQWYCDRSPPPDGIHRGRQLVLDEFDRLAAPQEQEPPKKEASHQAVPSLDAVRPGKDANHDGYSKAEADRHAAAGIFATIFANAKTRGQRRASATMNERRRSSIGSLSAEKVTKIPMTELALALNRRLAGGKYEIPAGEPGDASVRFQISAATEGSGTHGAAFGLSSSPIDSIANLDSELYESEPGTELLTDLVPFIHQMQETAAQDSSEESVARVTLVRALELWEKTAIPKSAAPKVVVAVSSERHFKLSSTRPQTSYSGTGANAAGIVADLLKVPHVHLPSLLVSAQTDYEHAVAAAHAAALAAAEEEERRKKEAEEAAKKKAKAKGGDAKKAPAPAHPPEAKVEILPPVITAIDPAVDPAGAIAQQLQKAQYAQGFVLTGVPVDNEDAAKVHAALEAAQLLPSLVICLTAASSSSSGEATARSQLQARASHRTLAHKPSERLLFQAAAAASSPHTGDGSIDAGYEVIPASLRTLGYAVIVEGDLHVLQKTYQRLHGGGLVKPETSREPSDDQMEEAMQVLREFLLSTLLHEGVLQVDPTEAEFVRRKRAAKHSKENGKSNAFAITLCCVSAEHESRFVDLLAGAFEAFPDREYCVLTQPHTAPDVLMLRRFIPATPSPNSTIDQTLYICHRDSLACPALISVRRAALADRMSLLQMVSPLPDGQHFMEAVIAAETEEDIAISNDAALASHVEFLGMSVPRIVVFVAELDKQIVCACVLSLMGCTHEALDAVSQSFDLEQLLNPSFYALKPSIESDHKYLSMFGSLLHIVCNPAFMQIAPFFLRQCMRKYFGRTGLFYRQQASPYGQHLSSPLPPAVKMSTLLVKPRQLPELTPAQRAAKDAERERRNSVAQVRFAGFQHVRTIAGLSEGALEDPRRLDHVLYVTTPPLSIHPPPTVNNRVVIVGASDAALSLAFTLLTGANFRLPHITLVSPGGLPQPFDYLTSPAPFVSAREFTAFELARMPLSSFVRVIDDVVVRISRKDRYITLASDSTVNYDYLVLLPGLTEATWSRLGYDGPEGLPSGVHCLLHANAVAELAQDVELLASAPDAVTNCMVFGDTLDALVAVNALMDRGIPPSKITLIQPHRNTELAEDRDKLAAFLSHHEVVKSSNATLVEQRVRELLLREGVTLLNGFDVETIEVDDESEHHEDELDEEEKTPQPKHLRVSLRSLHQSSAVRREMEGNLLICADVRDVDPRFFQAVNECGIVYDGRLVVDHTFRATDPHVLGGGSVAKFSRKYRAAHFLQHYDSREVGAVVAMSLLHRLDPFQQQDRTETAASSTLVADPSLSALLPKFSRPKATKALLPGHIHFLRVRLPEFELGETGRELCSGFVSEGEVPTRFLRLVLDRFDRLVELEYAGVEAAEFHNLSSIVGHQADILNGLLRKYAEGFDMVEFLRGEWASALFHDRFDALVQSMRTAIQNDQYVTKLLNDITAAFDSESPDVAMQQVRKTGVGVVGAALPAATRRKVEMQVLTFLRAQKRVLSGYFIPNLK